MDPLHSCNICFSENIRDIGTLKPYRDFETPIYECGDCGCRFAPRDESMYELLHTSGTSSYAGHRRYASKLKELFDRDDIRDLKEHLSRTPKNQFIIESVDSHGERCDVLELGCSCGYLTSYAIKAGHTVLGVDVSPSAIEAAREIFGDHFAVVGSPEIEARAPYDIIYHVGTIGCVEDPIGFTMTHFEMLKPGGILVFNCPNVANCIELDQLWVPSCAPPDLVSLFSKEVWRSQFEDEAEVEVTETSDQEPRFDLSRLAKRFVPRDSLFKKSSQNLGSIIRRLHGKASWRLFQLSKKFGTRGRVPSEYGLHVILRKRD